MAHRCLVSALAAITIIASPVVAQEPTASGFEGFYVGAHAGYGKISDTGDEDVEGALGGFHGGYNHMFGALLVGAEADYDWSDVGYSLSNPLGVPGKLDVTVNYYASIRGRLGWAHRSALFYATAGYSWSELEASVTLTGIGSGSQSVDANGFVGGAGLDYRISDSVSARIEGLHYRGTNDDVGDDAMETNVIRAGFSYHLR